MCRLVVLFVGVEDRREGRKRGTALNPLLALLRCLPCVVVSCVREGGGRRGWDRRQCVWAVCALLNGGGKQGERRAGHRHEARASQTHQRTPPWKEAWATGEEEERGGSLRKTIR